MKPVSYALTHFTHPSNLYTVPNNIRSYVLHYRFVHSNFHKHIISFISERIIDRLEEVKRKRRRQRVLNVELRHIYLLRCLFHSSQYEQEIRRFFFNTKGQYRSQNSPPLSTTMNRNTKERDFNSGPYIAFSETKV